MTEACIFDLDGVLVDTIGLHFDSWQVLSHHLGHELPSSLRNAFRGASRLKSLQIVLDTLQLEATPSQKESYCEIKNIAYLKSLENITKSILLPGVDQLLEKLYKSNIKVGLASASGNAKNIINAIGINNYFDTMVDANDVTQTKPHPEVFLTAANNLDCSPSNCLVFEDSPLGIEAAIAGGFKSIGIGELNSLKKADLTILNLEHITFETIHEFCKKND